MRELESGKRRSLDQNDGEGEREGVKQQMWQHIVSHSQGFLHTLLTTEIWNLPVLNENWATHFSRRSVYTVLHKEG